MSIHVFGIRHHGPGCARCLRTALTALQPDIMLVEGPPDAQEVLSLAGDQEMQPPIALLIYPPDAPQQAVYYPFTHFSPEWQALQYALQEKLPFRFMDLPQSIQMALVSIPSTGSRKDIGSPCLPKGEVDTPNPHASSGNTPATPAPAETTPTDSQHTAPGNTRVSMVWGASPLPPPGHPQGMPLQWYERASQDDPSSIVGASLVGALGGQGGCPPNHADPNTAHAVPENTQAEPTDDTLQDDPLALLAQAAGYTNHEQWWEQHIEQRRDMHNLFEGILEAMTALRADATPKSASEALREAYMRQTIRAAQKEGYQRIAVVCGAWHAPVLVNPGPAKADAALLAGLKKVKVEATWIPWTNSRLSYRSGYGAGVSSPGWYEHLWTVPDRITIHWLTRAAHLLREQGLDTSSANVIEAVRLSETLAALRDLPMPGLTELHEAIETVLCNGNATPMSLIRDKLEIGEKLGQVPSATPAVPLQRDLEAKQRRLRLKASTEIITLDLDLRKETDRARSQLLHQLSILNIHWGVPQYAGNKSGTFHEVWQVQWRVEFVIALIEANVWGNTIELATTAFVRHKADTTQELPPITALLDKVILAELPAAVDHLLQEIQKRAAVSADVRHLMDSLPPLARVARYGNVRQTKAERIMPVIDGLFERIIIGLAGACASLDDDAAQQMVESIDKVQESVSVLNRDDQRAQWQQTLFLLMDKESIHGLLRGRCCRLLLEQNVLDEEELQRRTRLALSPAIPATQAAAWIAGVLRGNGLVVLHQDSLWRALDRWLSDLSGETFDVLLPLLRRAFSHFQAPERRVMGDKVKQLHTFTAHKTLDTAGVASDKQDTIDHERAALVLPVLAQIMGVTLNGH